MERYVVEKGVLDISNRDLAFIQSPSVEHCQSSCIHINLAHNRLQDLSFLQDFSSLTTLILDYNEVTSLQSLPVLDNLDTFFLNYNRISNLTNVCRDLQLKCQNLQHLSLVMNPCCPLFQERATEVGVLQYRQEVIKALPMLKSLDGSLISQQEKGEAVAAKAYRNTEPMQPVTVKFDSPDAPSGPSRSSTRVKMAKEPKRNPNKGMSEGNRFITNTEL